MADDPNTTPNAIADELYESVEPLAFDDAAHHYALKTVCYALAQAFEQLGLLVRTDEDTEPWAIIMDANRAPGYMLPYIAQFVGATIPVGAPEADARNIIAKPSNQERGTPASIVSETKRFLTGNKFVRLTERVTSAYTARLNIRVANTTIPAGSYVVNEANAASYPLIAALLAVKPAGVVLTVVVSVGTTVDELQGSVDSQTTTIDSL